jgi:hypothetical protein
MSTSKIQKIKDFISSYPKIDRFGEAHIDWTDAEAGNYGIMPTGESVISRTEDIYDNVVIKKQYNVSLYAMHFTVNDLIRLEASGWLEEFTEWIEEQSTMGLAPTLGDNPTEEYITAQNGMLFELSDDGITGRYQIQIQCFFEKHYNK